MQDKAQKRFPGLLILFTVTLLCVAVLGVLCVATVKAERAMTERYAETVQKIYARENRGQQWLAEVDAARDGEGAIAPEKLPEDTAAENGIVSAELSGEGWKLRAAVRIRDDGVEIIRWTKQAEWQEDTSLSLWQEEETWK